MKIFSSLVISILIFSFVMVGECGALSKTVPLRSWQLEMKEAKNLQKHRKYEEAETHYSKALDLVRKTAGHTRDDEVLCLNNLANILILQDQADDALPLYKKALALLKKEHGKKSILLVPAYFNVGSIYENEGVYHKALKYYLRANQIAEEVAGTNSMSFARCQHHIGLIKFKQVKFRDAESNYFASLNATLKQAELASSEFLVELLSDYIDLMRRTENEGKILKSKFQAELLHDNLDRLKQKRGVAGSYFSKRVSVELADKKIAKSPSISSSSTKSNPASRPSFPSSQIAVNKKFDDQVALQKINKQRIDFYERMIEVDIKSLGPDHPSVARDLSGLASVYLVKQEYDQAKPLLQRALKIYEKNYKSESVMIKQTKALLRLISAEEDPQTRSVFTSYLSKLPPLPLAAQKIEVALRLNYLAFMLYCQGRISNSEVIYHWALSATARATGEDSLLSASSMADLSRLLRLRGRAKDAALYENNARAIWRQDLAERKAKILP